jgi:hypothetical protein
LALVIAITISLFSILGLEVGGASCPPSEQAPSTYARMIPTIERVIGMRARYTQHVPGHFACASAITHMMRNAGVKDGARTIETRPSLTHDAPLR